MTTRADLTAQTNTALHAPTGTRFAHCVEMLFGSTIRARLTDPTMPDTFVRWTGRGDLGRLRVYTSIDDGRTWQRVTENNATIPGVTIGQPTTNLSVLARLVFLDGAPGLVIDTFTLGAFLEDGTLISRVESGSDLTTGTLINVRLHGGGLAATPDLALRFFGNRGGLTNPNTTLHLGNGDKTGLHLAHGVAGNFGQEYIFNNTIRQSLDHASMGIEAWIYPEKVDGVLFHWGAPGTQSQTRLNLVGTTATTAKLQLLTRYHQGQGNYLIDANAGTLVLNKWQHVAMSYDGQFVTLYLNGVPVGGKALTFPERNFVPPTHFPFFIGLSAKPAENSASLDSSFQGRMTEVRAYGKPLTAGAIVQRMFRRLHDEELAHMVADEALAAYWPLNAGHRNFALDFSGNSNDLVFVQHQVGTTHVRFQLGWMPDQTAVFRGFPAPEGDVHSGTAIDEVADTNSAGVHPGRQAPPLSLDTNDNDDIVSGPGGEVVRVTDAPFNVTFSDGRVFQGVGTLGRIERVQESGDLAPTGIELSLSGIPTQFISIALNTAYLDRPCRVYQVTWDSGGVMLDPFLLFDGKVDTMPIIAGKSAIIGITAESNLRNWRRTVNRRWNDEGQRALWPDDHGFEFLDEMVDRVVWWPPIVRETAE